MQIAGRPISERERKTEREGERKKEEQRKRKRDRDRERQINREMESTMCSLPKIRLKFKMIYFQKLRIEEKS